MRELKDLPEQAAEVLGVLEDDEPMGVPRVDAKGNFVSVKMSNRVPLPRKVWAYSAIVLPLPASAGASGARVRTSARASQRRRRLQLRAGGLWRDRHDQSRRQLPTHC